MLKTNSGKFCTRYLLPLVAVGGIGLWVALINTDESRRPETHEMPAIQTTVQKSVDPYLLEFYPNGSGQSVPKSGKLELQMPGNARSLTINFEIADGASNYFPAFRVVLIRNPEGPISDQIISLKTDEHENFPAKAVISEADGSGNRALYLPVESGMRFVRYLVLAWDAASERFVPLRKGAEFFPIEIDGEKTKTATLINPKVEHDGLFYESQASASEQELVRCSRIVLGGFETIFEGNFNRVGVSGDLQLEISEPPAKTSRKTRRPPLVKTAVIPSYQIDDTSPGWSCNEWLEKLRSLKYPTAAGQGSLQQATGSKG